MRQIVFIFFVITGTGAFGTDTPSFDLSPQYFNAGSPHILEPWFILSDERWQQAYGDENLLTDLKGEGRFRLILDVDPALVDLALNLYLYRPGQCELFLDGQSLGVANDYHSQGLGTPQFNLKFTRPGKHILELIVHSENPQRLTRQNLTAWFRLNIMNDEQTRQYRLSLVRNLKIQNWFLALALCLGFLHLVLHLFIPTVRSNLSFGITMLLLAGSVFFDFEHQFFSGTPADQLFYLRIHRGFVISSAIALHLFIYRATETRPGKAFALITAGFLMVAGFVIDQPINLFNLVLIFAISRDLDIVRLLFGAARARKPGARLLYVGLGAFYLSSLYDLLLDVELMEPVAGIQNTYYMGYLAFLVIASIMIARNLAFSNQKIIEQERQAREAEMARQALEEENRRKTLELEEARQLQLSMLPASLPLDHDLEMAAFMRTATEVGGDYYDFQIDNDSMTVLCGDATGHGLKAGIMVTAFKALFVANASRNPLEKFLTDSSTALRAMNMNNMFMAASILQFRGNRFTAITAGMPPILLYRAASSDVEIIKTGGVPLGILSRFNYKVSQVQLEPGDSILTLSDGLLELFDGQGRMLGFDAVIETFRKNGHHEPKEIIESLNERADQWSGGREPDDDITMVALRYRPRSS